MKRDIHANSLFLKIVCTVVVGISSLAFLLGAINLTISKKVFVESFAESQMKIFQQIDHTFYQFYSDMVDVTAMITSNENVKTYLTEDVEDEVTKMANSFRLERQLDASKISEYNEIRVFLLGENEKSYIYSKSDVFSVPKRDILDSDVALKAKANPNKIICQYQKSGFTNVTKEVPVVIMAKALSYEENGTIAGVVFITIKESDIGRMYRHFTSGTSNIVLLNQNNEVVSSDNLQYLEPQSNALQAMEQAIVVMSKEEVFYKEIKKAGDIQGYLMHQLQSTEYKLMGIINPNEAFKEQYGVGKLVGLTLLIASVIVGLIFVFVRQQTRPLAILVDTMRHTKETKFKEQVEVQGTYEVRELSSTYNRMVEELDHYIHQLIQVEEGKRAAEIHALQMQINPHYMYNTLASIKWLIWQGDVQKSTQVVDAFILLLRNVISNSDEFVTIEQELINLKNYVLINQARYGEAIDVEFFVLPQCTQFAIPKLILQPFLENAFFHAFPEGQSGRIQIFIKEEKDNLRFDIIDNGVGMNTEQLKALTNKEEQKLKSEHFTGIGIGNVDDRIKLIYGMDYGINILGREGEGTTITLVIPKTKQ